MFIWFWSRRLWADPSDTKLLEAARKLRRLGASDRNSLGLMFITGLVGGMGWMLLWESRTMPIGHPFIAWVMAIVGTAIWCGIWPYRRWRRRQVKAAESTIRSAQELGVAIGIYSTTWRLLSSALFYRYRIEVADLVDAPDNYSAMLAKYVADCHTAQQAIDTAGNDPAGAAATAMAHKEIQQFAHDASYALAKRYNVTEALRDSDF